MRRALRALPSPWRQRLRRLNRLRWGAKARLVRTYRARGMEIGPRAAAAYVLWSPEVGDHSYDLGNPDELVAVLAAALDVPAGELERYVAEARSDPWFTHHPTWRRHRRFDMKRRIGIGRNVAWYAAARAHKPALVVETGVKHGIGALALLVALRRNAAEGRPGRLVSFDVDEGAGWLVPEELRENWRLVLAPTEDALEREIAGQGVELYIHDTPSDEERQRFELETAARHGGERLVLLTADGDNTDVMPLLARERGWSYHFFREAPADHWYRPPGLGISVVNG